MPLNLKSRSSGDVYVIECAGTLGMGETVKALEVAFEQGARESSRFVVNLSAVSRVDSTALGLLVRYADRMSNRGGGVRLAAAPAFVARLLEMTKLSRLIPSYPTEEDAVVSFGQEGPSSS